MHASPVTRRTFSEDVATALDERIKTYLELEDRCGVSKSIIIPLRVPFERTEAGAEHLAIAVRKHCGIGTAIIYDAVELFENQGARILFEKLPKDIESLSFFDRLNQNLFIFLQKDGMTPERQQFRLLVEIANAFLFMAGCQDPVEDTARNRRFAKRFAAAFLLPEESVRASVLQLNLPKNAWTYELLLRIKNRFGVSAESFAIRLDELGLLDTDLRKKLEKQIFEYYRKHPNDKEPQPSNRILSCNGRYEDLTLRAAIQLNTAKDAAPSGE